MNNDLYTDIETIPAQRPDIIAEIRASKEAELKKAIGELAAPSNYGADAAAKFIATKTAALQESFEDDVEEAYRKTGLDGSYGQVCVIGWALNDGGIVTHQSVDDESSLLREFNAALEDIISRSNTFNTCVIGHNVAAFDLRFLVQRSIVNGIKPHPVIARAAQAKPWEIEKVFDTMVQWAGIGNRIKLDKLCKALGIPTPKGDITGATVWDAVKAGRIDDVAAYCGGDVGATRLVHKRMTYQIAPPAYVPTGEPQSPALPAVKVQASELPETIF